MILRSSWKFWKACNVLYNSSLKCILRYFLELGEKLPWSWVQNLPKLGQNFTKLFSSWTPIHKFITWDLSIFWENFVNQSCRIHGGQQLSFCGLFLNQNASWWKSGEKLGKNKKIFILRKILSFENFQIQNPNFQNWFSWWTSFIFWHILMNYDPWHLILTKKSKFDFSVHSWLLISWL